MKELFFRRLIKSFAFNRSGSRPTESPSFVFILCHSSRRKISWGGAFFFEFQYQAACGL